MEGMLSMGPTLSSLFENCVGATTSDICGSLETYVSKTEILKAPFKKFEVRRTEE